MRFIHSFCVSHQVKKMNIHITVILLILITTGAEGKRSRSRSSRSRESSGSDDRESIFNTEPTSCTRDYETFTCPEEYQDDSLTSCCGEETAQHCCVGKDSGATLGIGGIVGMLVGMAFVSAVIFGVCFYINYRRLSGQISGVPAQMSCLPPVSDK